MTDANENDDQTADDRDPSNSDPDDFTEPLDPDDDVYSLVNSPDPS